MKRLKNIVIRTIVISGVLLIVIILGSFALDVIIDLLEKLNAWLNQTLAFFNGGKLNILKFVGGVLVFSIFMEIFGGFFARMLKKLKKQEKE